MRLSAPHILLPEPQPLDQALQWRPNSLAAHARRLPPWVRTKAGVGTKRWLERRWALPTGAPVPDPARSATPALDTQGRRKMLERAWYRPTQPVPIPQVVLAYPRILSIRRGPCAVGGASLARTRGAPRARLVPQPYAAFVDEVHRRQPSQALARPPGHASALRPTRKSIGSEIFWPETPKAGAATLGGSAGSRQRTPKGPRAAWCAQLRVRRPCGMSSWLSTAQGRSWIYICHS